MGLDISTLLIGSGFATFLALLAWGNQIREPKKEIKDVEKEFCIKFRLSRKEYEPIINETYPVFEKVHAIFDMMASNKLDEDKPLILEDIQKLRDNKNGLEKMYYYKYIITFILSISHFSLGFFSIYNGDELINDTTWVWDYLYLSLFIISIISLLTFIFYIFLKEEEFIKLISNTEDRIGVT